MRFMTISLTCIIATPKRTYGGRRCATNADCRLAYWQVNEVNIVVKCFNRFPITKLWVFWKFSLGIRNLLEPFTTIFTSFTCQSVSLQSAFVAHRVPAMIARHVQSAQRFHMKWRLRFKFPIPFAWGSNSPPLEDSDNQIPSSPRQQRCQMPGVCPWGGGVDVEASIDRQITFHKYRLSKGMIQGR